MNSNKFTRYNNRDPRYNFTIEDSTQYNKNIYPFHIKKKCSESYNKYKEQHPEISKCWGQGYEHCAASTKEQCSKIMKPYNNEGINDNSEYDSDRCKINRYFKRNGKRGLKKFLSELEYCGCPKCEMDLYDDVDETITWKDQEKLTDFVPKKLNNSNFIDRLTILKDSNPEIVMDKSPDTACYARPNSTSNDIDRKRKRSKKKDKDNIEPFLADSYQASCAPIWDVFNDTCGSMMQTSCAPCCPEFMLQFLTPEMSMACCLYVVCLIVCFPCIMSLCQMFMLKKTLG